MKLDLDVLRSCLIEVETVIQAPGDQFTIGDDDDFLRFYHFRQLFHAGRLEAKPSPRSNARMFTIFDLTPSGHELLKKMRNDTVWAKAKGKVSELGGQVPLRVMEKILDGAWDQLL